MCDETYNDEGIECPHCGYVEGDSWERSMNEGEDECSECGGKMKWVRDISISYSASKAE